MSHTKGHIDMVNDPVAIALEMLKAQSQGAEILLRGGREANPMVKMLHQSGLTVKRIREALEDTQLA